MEYPISWKEPSPSSKNMGERSGHFFGTLVHPHVEAINHQHFFVFRLDMDVDGVRNNGVMEMNGQLVPSGKDNPYSNAFVMGHTHFMTERQAQRDVNYESARCWHIMNNDVHNALGQHTGYMLMPGSQAKPFMPAAPSSGKRPASSTTNFG